MRQWVRSGVLRLPILLRRLLAAQPQLITPVLHDVRAGRTLGLEALGGAVVELGCIAGEPKPTFAAIFAATSLPVLALAVQRARLRAEPLPWPAALAWFTHGSAHRMRQLWRSVPACCKPQYTICNSK